VEEVMTKSTYVKTLAIGAVVAGLMTPTASPAYPTLAPGVAGQVAGAGATAKAAARQFEHTSTTHGVKGTKFQCGDLVLRVTKGKEIETQDGLLRNGVARLSIRREWRHVSLAGSNGRTYRASGVTAAWFVLKSPDFEHPVSGLEVIQLFFHRGPSHSPGWLREKIKITRGHESDVVSGPCNFG
jgi:hypothetical protein